MKHTWVDHLVNLIGAIFFICVFAYALAGMI
jgi:hypothetical protein